MSTCIAFNLEIELPDDVSDEYLDALVEDLTYEPHVERLENVARRWVRFVTGEPCLVSISVAEE